MVVPPADLLPHAERHQIRIAVAVNIGCREAGRIRKRGQANGDLLLGQEQSDAVFVEERRPIGAPVLIEVGSDFEAAGAVPVAIAREGERRLERRRNEGDGHQQSGPDEGS